MTKKELTESRLRLLQEVGRLRREVRDLHGVLAMYQLVINARPHPWYVAVRELLLGAR